MWQYNNEQILYSSSDLVTFLECQHASFLAVQSLGESTRTVETNSIDYLLQKKGLEHEAAYLQSFRSEGKTIVEIPIDRKLQDRVSLTVESMRSGADVIYQAAFLDPPWHGYCDFLIKCATPSSVLGDFSYEVLDTKLARTAVPKHIMQLCVYSDLLTKLQGFRPVDMHLFLGDNKKYSFRVEDFFYYYNFAKERFENHIQNVLTRSYPEPCSYCNFCHWHEKCNAQWEEDNHLSLVANIQRSQIDKLRKAGIKTLVDLANASDTKIPELSYDIFLRLRSQACLQNYKVETGKDKYEIIPLQPNKGFARMPKPDHGDLFFDMEGDPFYPNNLEYLFGIYYLQNEEYIFKSFLAHDHVQEKESFMRFMAFLGKHLAQHPYANIYHYNHYETTALKRLSCRYAVCEEQMDNLLRNHKFIDLYLVVKESIRVSESSYSLKNLETFYMNKRENAVTNAEDSIIFYNKWRENGDDTLLQAIVNYNELDCMSTHFLRDWLLTIKPDYVPWFSLDLISNTELQRKDWEIEYEDYQNRLGVSGEDPLPINERLSHLLEFHNREAKPQWWSSFDRQKKIEDELIDDTECLGGLKQIGAPKPEKRSLIYTYRFPVQEYKLKVKSEVINVSAMERAGIIFEIDDNACIVQIKRGASKDSLPESLSIGPSGPINSKIIRAAIYRYVDRFLQAPKETHAAIELLSRNIPRIHGKKLATPIISSEDLKGDALEAIAALDSSYLFIQGPPGAGKTYTSSHIIVDLIKRGKKIGITSNSHKAIHNLLTQVETVATDKGMQFHGIKKSSDGNDETFFDGKFISTESKIEHMDLEADLFAGTVWAFANPYFDDQLDYLFIDEAGQVAIANVVAMANSTKNIVMVGDNMQLGQPMQGTHPGEAGLSVLEFLLGDNATIAPERGIFLAQTRRMRSSICDFISTTFYDHRLTAHASTSERSLSLRDVDLPNEGVVMMHVDHEGCSQKSVEEGLVIKTQYEGLLGQSFMELNGTTRLITENDILVVTPYNVQVNYLRSLLPNARVGTVDKFQGQEAAIVLISMVTSSAEYLPRNIEFLYSRNRLNVAISRAQCLVIVVASPKLLAASCKTVEQMKLVNTFCCLDKYAFKA